MNYSIEIDNIASIEWGLSLQEAYLFAWFIGLHSWANKTIIEDKVFYFAARTKAIEELPLITDKPDTMYRYYKSLMEKGLIEVIKVGKRDYIHLTDKAKIWKRVHGKESDNSENNPTKLGNKSDNNSEINPTDNNTIIEDNNTNKYNTIVEVKNYKKFTKEQFANDIKECHERMERKNTKDRLRDFYLYWTEPNPYGVMRFQLQQTWETGRRLATWRDRAVKPEQGSARNVLN